MPSRCADTPTCSMQCPSGAPCDRERPACEMLSKCCQNIRSKHNSPARLAPDGALCYNPQRSGVCVTWPTPWDASTSPGHFVTAPLYARYAPAVKANCAGEFAPFQPFGPARSISAPRSSCFHSLSCSSLIRPLQSPCQAVKSPRRMTTRSRSWGMPASCRTTRGSWSSWAEACA